MAVIVDAWMDGVMHGVIVDAWMAVVIEDGKSMQKDGRYWKGECPKWSFKDPENSTSNLEAMRCTLDQHV